jgi:hypothetical protein
VACLFGSTILSVACLFGSTILSVEYFSTLSHKRHDFSKNVAEYKIFVLILTTNFVWNISQSKKNWARYDKKMCTGLHVKYRYFCPILIKLEFSWQIFEKYPNIKFLENPSSSGSRVVPCGQTDGRTDGRTDRYETQSRFSQFCDSA